MKENERGFTLVEAVVSVVTIAILFAVALPALHSFSENAEEKAVAQDILAALRMARSDAARYGLEYRVAFDQDERCFWLEKGDRASVSGIWSRTGEGRCLSGSVNLATGKKCTNRNGDGSSNSPENYIHFNPNGTSGNNGTNSSQYICVLDKNGNNRYRSGFVSTRTGRIVIAKWDEKNSKFEGDDD